MLDDDCIEVKKGCIVSVSAITNIKDKIYLCNGEEIDFTVRRRKAVRLEWLRCYERAALYGEKMEIEEYSPEIDANLRILCFQTFPGHCGCILHDMDKLQSMKYENWFGMAETDKKNRNS